MSLYANPDLTTPAPHDCHDWPRCMSVRSESAASLEPILLQFTQNVYDKQEKAEAKSKKQDTAVALRILWDFALVFLEQPGPSDLVHVVVVFRILHGHVGVEVIECHRRGQGPSVISMKPGSMVGGIIAVDPAGVVPYRVVADVGTVRGRGLVISVKNGRPVVRSCRGVVVSPPMFVTSMPSMTFVVCLFPNGLAGECATVSDSRRNDDDN